MNLSNYILNKRDIFQSVQEGILVCDLYGNIKFINDAFRHYIGIPYPHNEKFTVSQLIPEARHRDYKELTESRPRLLSEIILLENSDGLKESVHLFTFILKDQNASAYGVLMIVNLPVNLLKQERYAEDANPVLRAINTRSEEAWTVSDISRFKNIFCSDSLEEQIGWTSPEVQEAGWAFYLSLIHPDDYPTVISILMEGINLRNQHPIIYDLSPILFEYRILTPKQGYQSVQAQVCILERSKEGEVKYLLSSIKRLEPEEQLRELKNSNFPYQEAVKVIDGRTYLDLDFIRYLQGKKKNIKRSVKPSIKPVLDLTPRELEILKCIVEGLSSEEIGERLFVSKNTVNMHRKQIMKKMAARNLAELVRKTLKMGVL